MAIETTPATGAFSTPAWSGHTRGSSEYRRLLTALFFAGIATFAQLYSPQAALPLVAAELRIPAATSALLISSSTIGLAIGVIPWSLVADRAGRVRSMSIAVTAATIIGLLVPFAPTFGLLLAGRFVEGLMIGGVPAIAIAYLSEEIDPHHAARAAGTYVAGTTIGGLLGRLVAGSLAELTTWRVGVFVVAALCAVASALFVGLAPVPRGFVPRRGLRSPSIEGGIARLLAVNLRSPRLLALYAQGFLLMGGFVALYNYLAFRLASPPFDVPPTLVSLVFVTYLAGTWSAAQAGALAARFGRRPVLLLAIAVMIAGILLTLIPEVIPVLIGLVIATAGFFAAHAVASGWTASEATIGRAQASSLYNLAYYAGSSLFGWLGGVIFEAAGWGGTAGVIVGLAVLAAALAMLLLTDARATRRSVLIEPVEISTGSISDLPTCSTGRST